MYNVQCATFNATVTFHDHLKDISITWSWCVRLIHGIPPISCSRGEIIIMPQLQKKQENSNDMVCVNLWCIEFCEENYLQPTNLRLCGRRLGRT